MANRYWVGGTGNWNGTVGTRWAATSGGAGGQSVPTSADDVFFDAASGAVTVTIAAANTGAKSINCTGFTGTITGTTAISVSGSVTLVAGMTFSYTGTMSILATGTLTTAAKTFCPLIINAPGGTVTLGGGSLTTAITSTVTLTAGTLDLNGFSLRPGIFSSSNTNTRAITFGTASIDLRSTTAGTTVLDMGTATGFTYTGTGGFTRIQAATATVAFGTTGGTTTNAPNLTVSSGASALTIASGSTTGPFTFAPSYFKNLDFTGATCAVTVVPVSGSTTDLIIVGSLIYSNFGTYAITPYFYGTGTFISFGQITSDIVIDSAGGTISLGTLNSTNGLALYAGTLNTSGNSIAVGSFISSGTTAKTLNLSSSNVAIGGNFTATDSASLTVNSGTSTITMSSTGTKTFAGAGQTYYNLVQGGTGTLTISGSNTFNDFTTTVTGATSAVSFTAGTTQTFTNFTYTNTAPATTTFQSTTSGSTYTLSKASGTVNANRLLIQDSIATGGATWNATDSVNLGNNTGWNITASPGRYWVGGAASWDGTAGTKWATSSGGAGGASIPGLVDTAYFTAASTGAVTIATGNTGCNGFNCTGYTGTLTGSGVLTVRENITLVSGMTYSYTGAITLSASTIITSAGKTFGSITLSGVGASATLADSLTLGITNTFTLTQGALSLANFTLSTGSFSSSGSSTRSIAFGSGNIALTSTTATTTVLSMATATGFTYTGTGGFTRNQAATATVVFGTTGGSTTNAPNLTVNAGASTLTITTSSYLNDLNFTGSTSTVTGTTTNIAGNLTLASGGVYTAFTPIYVDTGTVTSNTATLGALSVNTSGTTVTLADALTLTGGLTLTQGTLNLAGFAVSATFFSSNNSNTRSLLMGSSTVTLSANGWNITTSTGMTLNAGTSTISMTSASAKSFIGGGLTYYNLNQGGAGALSITGSNTFNNITNSVQPTTVRFTAGTTQTVSNFGLTGTAANLVTINSVTAASQFTLSKANGALSGDYLSIQDSNATGGAGWYAGANSTNVSNNTGWIFTAAPVISTNMLFLFM